MFIPIGTDNPLRHRPLVNHGLIAINVVIFLLSWFWPRIFAASLGPVEYNPNMLHPLMPQLHQFITYAFLHANLPHLLGNMLFLYIFGNSVNDRLGHIGYILLYLGGAVFSGLGHVLTAQSPVLGASGAIAAVTGAYMVLFPKTFVKVFYWVIILIGTLEVPAYIFILFKLIVWDNILEPSLYQMGGIAYHAHLAGYLFGILVPMGMLSLKLLPHSQFDLWAVFSRWRRRQQFRQVVNHGANPFTGGHTSRVWAEAKVSSDKTPTDPRQRQIWQLRSDISEALARTDLAAAALRYQQLQELDGQQVLPMQQQLDVANKLMHMGSHALAADAYEKFLRHYGNYPLIDQVELMLGLLYSRYLQQREPARKYLQIALSHLSDPNQRKMCQDELTRLAQE